MRTKIKPKRLQFTRKLVKQRYSWYVIGKETELFESKELLKATYNLTNCQSVGRTLENYIIWDGDLPINETN